MPIADAHRPPAIETPLNAWVVHRVSQAVLPFSIRLGLHPNSVSIIGLAFAISAAAAYSQWRDPLFALTGFALSVGWLVCDGLDGQLARATGRVSAVGRFLDGLCDYGAFIVILLTLAVFSGEPAIAVPVALIAGAAHAFQSILYEAMRATYLRRLTGNFRAKPRSTAGGVIERGYNRLEVWLGNRDTAFDTKLLALTPIARKAALAEWTGRATPVLRTMSPLSADSRAAAILIACLAGSPFYYYWYELILLSLLAMAGHARLKAIEHDMTGGTNQ